jgi:hypothetical protein
MGPQPAVELNRSAVDGYVNAIAPYLASIAFFMYSIRLTD